MRDDELKILDDHLRSQAVPLLSLGLDEFGWFNPAILEVFSCVLRNNAPVIGGDVYYEFDGRLESAYANWHCEPEEGESKEAFVQRSIKYASDYLEKVSEPEGKRAVFVPVIGRIV